MIGMANIKVIKKDELEIRGIKELAKINLFKSQKFSVTDLTRDNDIVYTKEDEKINEKINQRLDIKIRDLNISKYSKRLKNSQAAFSIVNNKSEIINKEPKNYPSPRKNYSLGKSSLKADAIEESIKRKKYKSMTNYNYFLESNKLKTNSKPQNFSEIKANKEEEISQLYSISQIKNRESQSRKSTMDSEYERTEYQDYNKEDTKLFKDRRQTSIIIVDKESRKDNKGINDANIENDSIRKIKYKRRRSLNLIKSRIKKYESIFYKMPSSKERTSKSMNKYNISDNNLFKYDSSYNNYDKQSQEEIYSEIKNGEKIYYLTKNIIDFYNKYITICKDGILIDRNKYPLPKFPKISVIIPLYNASKFLNYSLRSIQNQKMKEIEIILIDDCSTDNTLLLVKKFMEEDPRIKLIKNKVNRKILYSKSIGALNANGKYIMQLDQDDLFIRDDLFDIVFNEAENSNLDLVQIKDITSNSLYIENKTRVNCHRRYQVNSGNSFETMQTHYETSEQLKNKLFIDGYVFTLWGLLIKTDVYKRAIYYFWPVILNYKFTYYEDYIMTTIIICFSRYYKFLNIFGLMHIKHKSSAMAVYSKYLLEYLLLFENVLYKYYIKNHPEDIKIIINILKKYNHAFKEYYKEYPKLFEESIVPILNNEYLSKEDADVIRDELEIKAEDFNYFNSYQYLMNSNEFLKLSNFQKSIINDTQIISNLNQTSVKISIIIYCKKFKYLSRTINSILNQNFKDLEIIIIYDNNESSNLKLIQYYIKESKNIHLITNHKEKGYLFSYSSAVLASSGEFVLLLKQGDTLAEENTLNHLYNEIKKVNFDILEFNILINNFNLIENNSLSLYRCTHFESVINYEFINYDKNYINLDKEKDVLTNKLIKASFFKEIINKYKILDIKDIIFNYYNEIFLFLFSKEDKIFRRTNEYGIIVYNSIYKVIFYDIINNNNQKVNDAIFYIDYLFENTPNTVDGKKTVIKEYFYLLSKIYNKFNETSNKSIELIEKFIKSDFITSEDKNHLKFYYKSCIN